MTRRHASLPLDKCREQLTGRKELDKPQGGKRSAGAAAAASSSSKSAAAAPRSMDEIEHPAHLVCPLTLELFEDPVSTIHGHSYERKALEQALAVKHVDPMIRAPLTPQQVFPNIAIRQAVEEYRKAVAAAKPWWQS